MRIAKRIYGSIATIEYRIALLDQTISRVRPTNSLSQYCWVTLVPAFPAKPSDRCPRPMGTHSCRGTGTDFAGDFAAALANQFAESALIRIPSTPQEISMAAKVKPIPDGFHTVTPYLIVNGAKKVVDFMQQALGAKYAHEPALRPDGAIMHATLSIGDSMVMISEASEHAKAMPVMLYLYVPNVDAAYQQAVKAGATSIMEPSDQFYGDRSGGVKDPAGNSWFFGTHIEDVSAAELKKRTAEFFKKQKAA
jgi:PhnB protein